MWKKGIKLEIHHSVKAEICGKILHSLVLDRDKCCHLIGAIFVSFLLLKQTNPNNK